MLNLEPRFGPKVCGLASHVKLETQIRAKGLLRDPNHAKLETKIRAKGSWIPAKGFLGAKAC